MAARGQVINHCSTHRQIASWVNTPGTAKEAICPVCVCPILIVLAHGRVMAQTACRTPARSAHPRAALPQPTKHKLVQEAQTTLPLPQQATQPRAQMALIPKTTCVWPALQASAEKLCIPFVVVCCTQIRGKKKMYSHLFQFRHKQHPWQLWCIPHQVLPSLAYISALSLWEKETEDKMSLNYLKIIEDKK